MALFVPELESGGSEPVLEGEFGYRVEACCFVVGVLEVVVGDADAEVVDVVEADVSGEELQYWRQLQV